MTDARSGNKHGSGGARNWRSVRPQEPCPVCGRMQWCRLSEDGMFAACRHQPDGAIRTKTDKHGAEYHVHRLSGDAPRPRVEMPSGGVSAQRADADTLHAVYDALLGALILATGHRDQLRRRGLSDAEIDRRLYRSLPVQGRAAKARALAERFGVETLLSVPGVVAKHSQGGQYITLAGCAGLLIPCRDAGGKIIALKVRRDDGGHGNRYSYLSSAKYGGPSPGSPVHVPFGTEKPAESVRVTEGELKADVAFILSKMPTISVSGVTNWKRCLPVLRQLRTKQVIISFDRDADDKPAVARALADCYGVLAENYNVAVEKWGGNHKGIDDVLAAGGKPEVLEGDAARDFVAETLLTATAGEPLPPPNPLDHLADVLAEGGAAKLFGDGELLDALAGLAESDPAAFAARRAAIKNAGVGLRDFDTVLKGRRAALRAALPPRVQLAGYKIDNGVLVRDQQTAQGVVVVPLSNFTAKIVAETTRDDGAERSVSLTVEGTGCDGRPLPRTEVRALDFAGMDWILPAWGTRAVVYAGRGTADHLRVAVQLLSGDVAARTVYAHLGWRRVGDGWVYLHGGGGIGEVGPVEGIEVAAGGALERYVLPAPPAGDDLRHAARASLALLDLAPARLAFPLLAAVYRAPLGAADFAVHLAGQSGVYKSECAALLQQHFGAAMDRSHLPAGWASTANSLEATAFAAKDALLTVDDFAPQGAAADVNRLHGQAERLFRAQGNSAGRGRMRRDGSLAPAKPPRGLILSTGEDVPRGQSLRARLIILEVGRGDISAAKLTACQRDAANGLYAAAMSAYLRWLAPRIERVQADLAAQRAQLRDAAADDGQHARTPNAVADMAIGLRHLLDFAENVGAIDVARHSQIWEKGWAALREVGAAQSEFVAAADPVGAFLRLLSAALASGRAHVAATDGGRPETASAWGWRREDLPGGPTWRPQGRRVGWVDGDNLYLEPEAAYAAAQALAGEQGEGLAVSPRTLWTRLRERGLLAELDTRGGRTRFTVRRRLEGKQLAVLFLRVNALLPQTSGHCGHGGHFRENPAENEPSAVATPVSRGHSRVATTPEVATEPPCANGHFHGESEGNGHRGHNGHSFEGGSSTEKPNSTSSSQPPEMGTSLPCQTGGEAEREAEPPPRWIDPDADPRDLDTPFENNGHAPPAPPAPPPRRLRPAQRDFFTD